MPKTRAKNPSKNKRNKFEVIPYELGYITDPRKVKAAQILAFSGRGAITLAAKEANVNRNTIYYWLDDPLFVSAIEEAAKELAAVAAKNVRNAIVKGSLENSRWFLERALPQMFDKQLIKDRAIIEAKSEEALGAPETKIEFNLALEHTADHARNSIE